MPNVSVIIPTYNCKDYITESVESVLRQTYKDFEIIVIDDGSNDATRKVLSGYIDKNLIKYLYQTNSGHACARNLGIKHAKGKIIAFLDSDDTWAPDKLECQVSAFNAHPDIGLVHADIYIYAENGDIRRSIRSSYGEEMIRRHSGDIFNDLLCRNIYVSSPTAVVRKICFDKVGLFDEKLSRLGFEDTEMWLRITKHYKACYIHKPLAYYRVREASASKNHIKMAEGHRYAISKLSSQYNLSTALKNKAIKAMYKEWGLREYRLLKILKRIIRTPDSKPNPTYKLLKKNARDVISRIFNALGIFNLMIFINKLTGNNRAAILMYHRVSDFDEEKNHPYYLAGPSVRDFEHQMSFVSKRLNVITLKELVRKYINNEKILPNTVIVTVDDGYIDCYKNMFPVFKKYNINATIFINSGYVNSKRIFWIDELAYRIKKSRKTTLTISGIEKTFKIDTLKNKIKTISFLVDYLKSISEYERLATTKEIFEQLHDVEEVNASLNLTWNQIREMSASGIEFGAHTVNHPILSRLNDSDAQKEILASKKDIEKELGKPVLTFCYPSGEKDTFNEFHKKVLKESGFISAVSTVSGSVNKNDDLFELKRISVDRDDSMPIFISKLLGIFEVMKIFRQDKV